MSSINITKELTELVNLVKKCGVSNVNDSEIASILVARTVAYNLPLPSMEVEPPVESWYISNCTALVEVTLCVVNESFVIDLDTTTKLIRSIWRTRYNMLHEPDSNESITAIDIILSEQNNKIPSAFVGVIKKVKETALNEYLHHIFRLKAIIREKLQLK